MDGERSGGGNFEASKSPALAWIKWAPKLSTTIMVNIYLRPLGLDRVSSKVFNSLDLLNVSLKV
jgi:hypothetical protein